MIFAESLIAFVLGVLVGGTAVYLAVRHALSRAAVEVKRAEANVTRAESALLVAEAFVRVAAPAVAASLEPEPPRLTVVEMDQRAR